MIKFDDLKSGDIIPFEVDPLKPVWCTVLQRDEDNFILIGFHNTEHGWDLDNYPEHKRKGFETGWYIQVEEYYNAINPLINNRQLIKGPRKVDKESIW